MEHCRFAYNDVLGEIEVVNSFYNFAQEEGHDVILRDISYGRARKSGRMAETKMCARNP